MFIFSTKQDAGYKNFLHFKREKYMALKRDISKTNLLFLSIGSIIGSGWLFGSFYTAQIAGPAAILSWIFGGVFIAIIALTLAELSTMLPLSGGSVTFSALSHGKMCGAVFGWITWLWSMVVAPIEVQAVIQYSSNYLPGILHPQNHVLTFKGLGLAAILMFVLSVVNMVGVKAMAEANKFIVFWKLIIPIGIAAILVGYEPHWSNLTAAGGFAPHGWDGIFSGISTGGVALSFFGFQTAIFLAGEAKNPQKSIPFSLFGSLLACTILYAVLQLGFVLSVDPASLSQGWKHIYFQGEAGPFAGIFIGMGLVFAAKILYFDAVISPLGTAVGYVAASSRILYSMSLQHDAPRFLSKTNRFSVPWIAIMANFIFGMLFFLPFGGWQSMASFLSAAIVLSLVPAPICLPIFRKKFPNLKRPFVLPFAKAISFLSFYLCSLLLHWTGWETIKKLDVMIVIGLFVFFISHFFDMKRPRDTLHLKSFVWLFLYLVISAVLSYLGEFGGGIGVLSMKFDFLILLATSGLVFWIAQKTTVDMDQYEKDIYKTLSLELNDQAS